MRTFEDSNGNIIFSTEKNATRLSFDTCKCIIIYDTDGTHLFTQIKCNTHKLLSDQTLLDTALANCATYNLAVYATETLREQAKASAKTLS